MGLVALHTKHCRRGTGQRKPTDTTSINRKSKTLRGNVLIPFQDPFPVV